MIDRDETVTLNLTIDETIQVMLALKNEVNLASDKAREASREGLRKYWLRELDKVTPILQKVTSALAGDRVAAGHHDHDWNDEGVCKVCAVDAFELEGEHDNG